MSSKRRVDKVKAHVSLREHLWGHEDTEFFVNSDGCVELSGERYSNEIGGKEFPHLIDWIESELGLYLGDDLSAREGQSVRTWLPATIEVESDSIEMPLELRNIKVEFSLDLRERLKACHGQSLQELCSLMEGASVGSLPNVVFFPKSHDEAVSVVSACNASKQDVVIVPVGGATNVSQALLKPRSCEYQVCLSSKKMTSILWTNLEDRVVCVQAGVTGAQLESHLNKSVLGQRLTCGHFPDSAEFSTVGGWVSTQASGMRRAAYGNVEDLVLGCDAVLGNSTELIFEDVLGRVSSGIKPQLMQRALFGSEGRLGFVTKVYLKIFLKPKVEKFVSFLFPNFFVGLNAMRDLEDARNVDAAAMRLVDNAQFKMGLALKPMSFKNTNVDELKKRSIEAYVVEWKKFDVDEICAATGVFEGDSEEDVLLRIQSACEIVSKHGGFRGDEESAKRGYFLTSVVAYLRDFGFTIGLLSESFETTVPWSKITNVVDAVAEVVERCVPSSIRRLVSCRVSQTYPTCVCLYFYVALATSDVSLYTEMERTARAAIMKAGGSISHHHGVGKIRAEFLNTKTTQAYEALKSAVDEKDVFGIG